MIEWESIIVLTISISVGTPTTLVFHGGKQMMFSRGEWEPSNNLKGLVNPKQLVDLINSTRAAINMGAEEIHVAF